MHVRVCQSKSVQSSSVFAGLWIHPSIFCLGLARGGAYVNGSGSRGARVPEAARTTDPQPFLVLDQPTFSFARAALAALSAASASSAILYPAGVTERPEICVGISVCVCASVVVR